MVTSGDRGAAPSTSPAGLKGLFVAEIVRALQSEEVDVAVHSAKDLPAEDPVLECREREPVPKAQAPHLAFQQGIRNVTASLGEQPAQHTCAAAAALAMS